jgi:hypothetical protein
MASSLEVDTQLTTCSRAKKFEEISIFLSKHKTQNNVSVKVPINYLTTCNSEYQFPFADTNLSLQKFNSAGGIVKL